MPTGASWSNLAERWFPLLRVPRHPRAGGSARPRADRILEDYSALAPERRVRAEPTAPHSAPNRPAIDWRPQGFLRASRFDRSTGTPCSPRVEEALL